MVAECFFPIEHYLPTWNPKLGEVAVTVCESHDHHIAIDHMRACSTTVASTFNCVSQNGFFNSCVIKLFVSV